MHPKHTFKDFIPLISIFATISIITVVATELFSDGTPEYWMRIFMGSFFLVFGLFKTLKWKGFVAAYKKYDLVAKHSTSYAYAYPLIEIGLGTAYIFNICPQTTNWTTLVIMTIGALGVANELRKKNEIPCACLGVVFKIPMTYVTLIEDLLMAAMAAYMLF